VKSQESFAPELAVMIVIEDAFHNLQNARQRRQSARNIGEESCDVHLDRPAVSAVAVEVAQNEESNPLATSSSTREQYGSRLSCTRPIRTRRASDGIRRVTDTGPS
jgi:hypothetical protein